MDWPLIVYKSDKVCFHCKKSRHIKKDCWFLKKQNGTGKPEKSDDKANKKLGSALMGRVTSFANFEYNEWILDSGATSHMTKEKEWLVNMCRLMCQR